MDRRSARQVYKPTKRLVMPLIHPWKAWLIRDCTKDLTHLRVRALRHAEVRDYRYERVTIVA